MPKWVRVNATEERDREIKAADPWDQYTKKVYLWDWVLEYRGLAVTFEEVFFDVIYRNCPIKKLWWHYISGDAYCYAVAFIYKITKINYSMRVKFFVFDILKNMLFL